MKKILLIGASGYIGRNIYEYLINSPEKYKVTAPSSKELNSTDEIEVHKFLVKEYYDVVINSAVHNSSTKKYKDNSKVLEYSLKMFFSFEKNSNLFGKMLYFGSGAEFNKVKDISFVSEDDFGKSIPTDDYGFSKYIIAKQIENSSNIYNLRLFGVYGKYEHWKSKFISNACCKAIKNIPISIRQNVYFDYLWIEDLCGIVEWFINNKPKFNTYNITSGKKTDLLTLANKVIQVSGKDLAIYICKEGFLKEYTSNNERLVKEIKNFEFTNIDKGIDKLYTWYTENEKDINLLSLLYNE